MTKERKPGYLWFKAFMSLGVILALILLVQSISTYVYVSGNLVVQEAVRDSARKTAAFERTIRSNRETESLTLGQLLDDSLSQWQERVRWLRIRDQEGNALAESGAAGEGIPRDTVVEALRERRPASERRETEEGPVLVTLSPLRAGPETMMMLEIASDLNSFSASFAPLRRNLTVGISAALALLAALVVIGFRFPSYLRSKQLENQVSVARTVQSNLLPAAGPRFDDIDFAAEFSPAWEVGGDFYDAFNVSDRRAAFMLGDVSGKGISAAVLMGFIHGAAHASAWTESAEEHREATGRLNNLLHKKTSTERFVSLCWGYFDRPSSVLHYVNAGHLPPLLFRQERHGVHVTRLDDGGPVLGLIPDVPYRAGTVRIEENDLLVIFSDGIVETAIPSGEEFGEARVTEAVRSHWHGSANDIREGILRELFRFSGASEAQDDRTLIVLRFQHSKRQQLAEEFALSRLNAAV